MNALTDSFDRVRGISVVVLGDLMLDRYLTLGLGRAVPEGTAYVVGQQDCAGAAGNAALNLQSMGATPRLVGFLGDDEVSNHLTEIFRGAGLRLDGMVRGIGTITTKTRLTVEDHPVRLDVEGSVRHSAWNRVLLRERFNQSLLHAGGILVSDYGRGTVDKSIIRLLAQNVTHIPIVIDAHDLAPYRSLPNVVLCPNAAEAWAYVGQTSRYEMIPPPQGPEGMNLAQQVLERTRARAVVVTLGANGAAVAEVDGPPHSVPATATPVCNAVGAGDTFAACLVLMLAVGHSVHAATHAAVSAASAACLGQWTTAVTAEDVLAVAGFESFFTVTSIP